MPSFIRAVIVWTFLTSTLILLVGCSGFGDKPDITKNWSAQRLYNEAKAALSSGDYETAIDYYGKIEARFPFGPIAQQAQLEVAYAHYRAKEPATAIAAADRFIKLHPQHPSVDYAYYLKGLTNFNRGKAFLDRFIPKDPARRDPSSARQAFDDFAVLTERFPESKYTQDAAQRMVYLRDVLAEHEIFVAKYYLRRGAYIAAINRAKYVVENYPSTIAVPDGLVIMAKGYKVLEMTDLAEDAIRVLELNFPDHEGIQEIAELDIN